MGQDYQDFEQCDFCGCMELKSELYSHPIGKRGNTFHTCETCEIEHFTAVHEES